MEQLPDTPAPHPWASPRPDQPWFRRRTVQLGGAAVACVLVAAVAGATDTGTSSEQSGVAGSLASRNGAPAGMSEDIGGVDARSQVAGGASQPIPSSGAAGGQTDAGKKGGTEAPSGPLGAGAGARVVHTGSVTLAVDEGKVQVTTAKLQALAKGAGGYLADQRTDRFGDSPTSVLTMRVPASAYERVLGEIQSKGFGAKVVSVESTGKDITAEYADTAAQIATLRAARARYLAILGRARTIGEVLSVQQRVDEVQGQIDRLEGHRRLLANQSDLATLTVSVVERGAEALHAEPGGWTKAWSDARDGFTGGIQALIAHSGTALLLLLVSGLVLLLARTARRLARRRLV